MTTVLQEVNSSHLHLRELVHIDEEKVAVFMRFERKTSSAASTLL
jgi:hypothetical protein